MNKIWILVGLLVLTVVLLVGIISLGGRKTEVPSPVIPGQSEAETNQQVFSPLSAYKKRLTVKWFGKYVWAEDAKSLPCGRGFTGYHIGDDLEILPGEENKAVPVVAIAAGRVLKVAWVDGYGGLIVVQHQLHGQEFTALLWPHQLDDGLG